MTQFLDDLSLPEGEVALLEALFEPGAYSISDDPPVNLGRFGDRSRWRLRFEDGSRPHSDSSERAILYLDLVREEGRKRWELADVRIPPAEVRRVLSEAVVQVENSVIDAIRKNADSLMTAEMFIQAVARKDYDAAIEMTDLNAVPP